LVALTFMLGCLRVGYDARPVPIDPTHDARHNDRGTARGVDAALADGGMQQNASSVDASAPSDSSADAANDADSAPGLDATTPQDTGVADDGAVPAAMDSGSSDGAMPAPMDSGSSDGGPTDAAASGANPCEFTATTNAYVGSPHYHGTLALQNAGAVTWTMPTIDFDLPSSTRVCNDVSKLPGKGWTLRSSGRHCTYTTTSPSVSIAPGATLNFEYSSNDPSSWSAPAALNIGVSGCL
jgi:hypothetical protein